MRNERKIAENLKILPAQKHENYLKNIKE